MAGNTQPPADALARVIRQEQHKTRVLLVWIFVGIPLVALLAIGLFVLAAAVSNAHARDQVNNGSPVGATLAQYEKFYM